MLIVTEHGLHKILDMVPVNKITMFGGDYRCVVQKVWGHLVITREIVAKVLAERIEDGGLSQERTLDIAKK